MGPHSEAEGANADAALLDSCRDSRQCWPDGRGNGSFAARSIVNLLGFEVRGRLRKSNRSISSISTATLGSAIHNRLFFRSPTAKFIWSWLEYRDLPWSADNSAACDPGSSHLSLRVNDIEAFHRRLLAGGFAFGAPRPR